MPVPSEHFRLETLADGVFAAIATEDGYGLCNAGIVDLGGSSLVFDAMLTPQAGTALGRAAERLTGRPVGLLVNSHYHGDHVRGSGAVGAGHVVSTRRVRELVLERGPVHLRSDREEAAGDLAKLRSGETVVNDRERKVFEGWFEGILATPADLAFRPPEITFEQELTVQGTRRSARILTFGGGHSPSDVLVWLPEERIAFLGDLLSVGFHPSLADGEPDELLRILDRIRALGIGRALPGHGPMTTDAGVGEMRRYVASLVDGAASALGRGEGRDAFARAPAPPPFDGWTFSMFYEANARFVYDHVARRRPAGADGGSDQPSRSK